MFVIWLSFAGFPLGLGKLVHLGRKLAGAWVAGVERSEPRESSLDSEFNITSLGGLVSGPATSVYSSSKFAVEGLTRRNGL